MTSISKFLTFTVLSVASSVAYSTSVPTGYTTCNAAGSERVFGLTSTTDCLAYGTGNINGNKQDSFLNSTIGADYEFISKTDTDEGTLTFSIDPLLWTRFDSLAVGVKVGNNSVQTWAIWSAVSSATEFNVFVFPEQGAGLSHFNIYGSGDGPGTGVDNPTPVPLPAAAWLFLSGLAGLVGFRKRKAIAKA